MADCPPGVHSMFDFCPGDCSEPVEYGCDHPNAVKEGHTLSEMHWVCSDCGDFWPYYAGDEDE